MWKFSPEENFRQFCHLLSLAKFFYHANFLSYVNDYMEDMAIFTTIYSTEYFCQTNKGSWAWRNLCQVKIIHVIHCNCIADRLIFTLNTKIGLINIHVGLELLCS